MLGIPTLKRLEGIVNIKLEHVTVENEAPMTKTMYKITEKYHGNSVKTVDHKNTPPKLEDSLGTKKGEDDLGSKLNIEDFVSKASDSFLQLQERIKALESVSVEDQTQECMEDLLCLRNELQMKKNMCLGLVNPIQGPQHMELQQAEYCPAFDKVAAKISKSADNTENREEMAPMKENPIQKPKLALKECNLCTMKFLNDKSLWMHKKRKPSEV